MASLNRKRKIVYVQSYLVTLMILFHFISFAQYPKVEIQNTERREIISSVLKQNLLLYVQLPESYGKKNQKYPVLYLLDGQWLFPLVSGLYGNEYGDAAIPEMIIVGITWEGKDPNFDSLRQSNYTPTRVMDVPGSGNAPNFLEFIKQELIPFIESSYQAEKDDRILMGGYLGGLFVAYTIFQETGLFNRYIMASPVLDWDNDLIFKTEKQYFNKTHTLNAKIFIAGGDQDYGINDITRFTEQFKSRNYKGLDLQTKILKYIGHAGTTSEGLNRGLIDLFAKPTLLLDSAVLNNYTGTYRAEKNGMNFKLFRKGSQLMMQYSDKLIFPVYAESNVDFYIKGIFILFKFKNVNSGKVEGVLVNWGTDEEYFKRSN
jgi:predicted alpha/beta superfamily hydrolase